MQRHAIGLIALVLLAVAFGIWAFDLRESGGEMLLGATVRVGLVMSALWLAHEQVSRLPAWLWAIIPLLLILLACSRRYFLIALPILLVLLVLRPRKR